MATRYTRDPQAARLDVRRSYYTVDEAAARFGVLLVGDDLTIDEEATLSRRKGSAKVASDGFTAGNRRIIAKI